MFEYATYNGVPIITYGLIGLTTGILALLTLNPDILELKENGEQTTIANAIGLDKIQMPEIPTLDGSTLSDENSSSYLPGINGLPQPFSTDSTDNEKDDKYDEEDDSEYDEEEDNVEEDDKGSSVMNPLLQNEKPLGGRKTRNKQKKKRQTKRNKK